MREQVCFWLCPYARIQGVMYDAETILPTYDYTRGEPRGKLKKGEAAKSQGDCIDCNQCVAVCPTGIDIREGQQEGCITCALCIDACDSVMDKVDRPRGLIRYASLDEIEGKPTKKLFQRPRVLVYFTIISIALAGIGYGLTHLGSVELKALHQRQPLFVRQSDGSIQNGYEIKILNKTDKPMNFVLRVSGMDEMTLVGAEEPLPAEEGHVTAYTVFVRVEPDAIKQRVTPIQFRVVNPDNAKINATYESMFVAPR
jgi:cytochrome c oxidase accessory protein FixG